jgi:hypothetical protein
LFIVLYFYDFVLVFSTFNEVQASKGEEEINSTERFKTKCNLLTYAKTLSEGEHRLLSAADVAVIDDDDDDD